MHVIVKLAFDKIYFNSWLSRRHLVGCSEPRDDEKCFIFWVQMIADQSCNCMWHHQLGVKRSVLVLLHLPAQNVGIITSEMQPQCLFMLRQLIISLPFLDCSIQDCISTTFHGHLCPRMHLHSSHKFSDWIMESLFSRVNNRNRIITWNPELFHPYHQYV